MTRRELKKKTLTLDELKDMKVEELAKKNCKRCYGRGYIGKMKDGKYSPCGCAQDMFNTLFSNIMKKKLKDKVDQQLKEQGEKEKSEWTESKGGILLRDSVLVVPPQSPES